MGDSATKRRRPWLPMLGFGGLLIALLAVLLLASRAERPRAMTFFFTADTQGYLVPCGCKTVPAGGLARRATALSLLKKAARQETVVPIEVAQGFADRGPAAARLNREMGRFFERTGTLVGLGGIDLQWGPEALHMAAPGVETFLAGREGHPGSKEYRLGGWRFGPFSRGGGVLRVAFVSETVPEGVPLGDPIAAFDAESRRHPAGRWIVAGQMSPQTVSKLLAGHASILAVVAQWGTTVTSVPQRTATGQAILFMGDRGRRCARLRVGWLDGRWDVMPFMEYLGPETAADGATAAEVEEVLKDVRDINRRTLSERARPAVPGKGFMGAAACGKCHAKAYETWLRTPHAKATDDLAIDHEQENPACLACHSTALGEPGGYPIGGQALAGVQCEACHGQGEGHPPRAANHEKAGTKTCGRCHTPRDSALFNPEGYWEVIKHGLDGKA